MMFRLPKNKTTLGFSLVEVLVYLAIFMVVATASVGFMISLHGLINQYRLETLLYRSGTNAMEQVLLTLRQAEQVNMLSSVFETPAAGVLVLENAATTTTFSLNSGALELIVNGNNYGDMTATAVTVDSFTVYHYPLAVGELIRIQLTITGTVDGVHTKQVTLYGGAKVRGAL